MGDQQSWPKGAAAAEWRAHWPLACAGMLGFSMIAVGFASLGPMMAPLEKLFGWSRSEISSGLTVYSIVSVICQPLVGRMIDLWGPRRIGLVGIVGGGAAIALFGTANGSLTVWLLLWLFYSLSAQLILTPVWTSAVASEFEAGRGLALAMTLSGSALSFAVIPLITTLLIAAWGWRLAYLLLGGGTAALLFPVIWLFFFSRRDRVRALDSAETAPAAEPAGATVQEAVRSPSFYKILIAIFASYSLAMAFSIHMMPILTGTGLSRDQAALIAGSFGLFAVAGKLLCGLLVERLPGHAITAAALLLPVLTCLILMMPGQSIALRLVAIAMVGMSAGAQLQMTVYMTMRHFGMRAYGTIFGLLGAAMTIAGGAGPFVAGYLFDLAGDYRLLLTLGIPLSIASSLIMLWVGGYPEVRAARRTARLAA
jgi:MFS family permease